MADMIRDNKRVTNSWALYDAANSVYSLCIATAIFPTFYENVTTLRDADGTIVAEQVSLFGQVLKNSVAYEYGLSVAFLIVALLSPFLSGIADYTGNKKSFMKFFVYLGSLSCMGLYFFDDPGLVSHLQHNPAFVPDVSWPITCFMLATIGFSGSLVFYNAYLPEICSPGNYEKLSARGFAMGYGGSLLLLALNLVMIQKPGLFGIENTLMATRISFLTVGVWWAGIAQITFANLPSTSHHTPLKRDLLLKGFRELRSVFLELRHRKKLREFLLAFFFLSMGVQTVMFVAALFGKKVMNLETADLIQIIMLIQLIAIAGSFLFAYTANKKGNITTLAFSTFIWIGICVAAYVITGKYQFYALAAVVGLVMGGVQSLCRATFTRLVNKESDTASYYSFYDAAEKISLVIGMAAFGFLDHHYNMRQSVLALMVFFIFALILLFRVRRVR